MRAAAALLTLAAAAAQAQPPPSLTLVVPRPACATSTPNLALCLGPIASELDGLRKLACLLDALERWRLAKRRRTASNN